MRHLTTAIWALFSIVVHLCIGAGCYAVFVADTINTGSALFWGWVGAWPAMLVITFWGVISTALLWIVGAIIVTVLAAFIFGMVMHYREPRP